MEARLRSSIDLTPIVGLLLALIVVLLSVLPGSQNAARLDQPPVHYPVGNDNPPPPPWFASVNADGSLWLSQGDDTPERATRGQILSVVPADERVYLRGDSAADYGSFAELAMFLQANDRQIAILNEDLDGPP